VDSILGEPQYGRMPTLNDGRQLNYVEATILETLRLETLVQLGVKRRTLCDTEINGFFVAKNTAVSIQLISLNHV
jgi:cytochrome P450